ncbi:MAG: LysE family transporter [Saprospiraceae bacterium]|nr:LysE family transporter [Saprospiraceae bacterium]
MTISAIGVLFISWIVSFIGSLPFGPINLVMIDTTLKNSFRSGMSFAIAAAIVEMGQSLVALHGSVFINQVIVSGPWFKVFGFIIFLILGLAFFFKKNQEHSKKERRFQDNHFLKGFVVAFLNPQAIPFWVIMLAVLHSSQMMSVDAHSPWVLVIAFLVGAALGKLCALMLFGLLSQRIIYRMAIIRSNLNRIIGIILIAIGMFQGILALAT